VACFAAGSSHDACESDLNITERNKKPLYAYPPAGLADVLRQLFSTSDSFDSPFARTRVPFRAQAIVSRLVVGAN
jgi:hypothetical protein